MQWIREVPGGIHWCILCREVVGWGDVYPKPEELTEDFRVRWRAHEATRPLPVPATQA